MAGLIVQLALSWLIVWLFERNNLRVLGLFPTGSRLANLLLFLFVTTLCCSTGFFLKMYFGGQTWQLNPNLNVSLFLNGLWWNIKSVLFEELIFRGVLFYILIKKLGAAKAILISAASFGIYHWFSFGVLGNFQAMVFTFFITGIMGLVYAYGYSKTMSLYVPIGIHLGWNFTQNFVFSDGPIGKGILIPITATDFRTDSYVIFFIVFLVPVLSALLVNYFLIKRKKQVDINIYSPNNARVSI